MAVIRATFTTMGQSSPASVSVDADNGEDGHYRWRKIPGWTPNDPRCRESSGKSRLARDRGAATRDRTARFAEFRRLREQENLTLAEAGQRIGVAINTARTYERERKDQQRRESGDG